MNIRPRLGWLQPADITIDNGLATIKWGNHVGTFPVTDETQLPNYCAQAILYLGYPSGDDLDYTIEAIDVMYPGYGNYISRLFGDKNLCCNSNKVDVTLRFTKTQGGPKHRLKTSVVRRDKELWFLSSNGTFFDTLNATPSLIGGTLYVVRDGETVEHTNDIAAYDGYHPNMSGFGGLSLPNLVRDYKSKEYCTKLLPKNFQLGDWIIVDIYNPPPKADLGRFAQEQACSRQASINTSDELGNTPLMEEWHRKFEEEFDRLLPSFLTMTEIQLCN